MTLSVLEQHVFGYYLTHGAQNLNIVGRYYPYGELVASIADKIRLGARKFGPQAVATAVPVAKAFLALMIEREAFSTAKQKIGNDMHQFQEKTYRQVLDELVSTDPVAQRAEAVGPGFWEAKFAELTAAE